MKTKQYLWVTSGDLTLYGVTYDGVTATAEHVERRLDGGRNEPVTLNPEEVFNIVHRVAEKQKAKRSVAAKKAAITRADRRDRRFRQVVQLLRNNGTLQPRKHCAVCGKYLTDPVSMQRGIGPECWGRVCELLKHLSEDPPEGIPRMQNRLQGQSEGVKWGFAW